MSDICSDTSGTMSDNYSDISSIADDPTLTQQLTDYIWQPISPEWYNRSEVENNYSNYYSCNDRRKQLSLIYINPLDPNQWFAEKLY